MADAGALAEVLDRRAALSAAFDEAEANPPTPELVPETAAERARDEAGKFVKAETIPEKAPKIEAAPEAAAAAPVVEEPLWKRPPKSWTKEHYETWNSAADPMRQMVHQREDQMRAGIESSIPKIRFADEINAAIEPYMPTMRGLGLEPTKAIVGLMEADKNLRSLPLPQRVAYLGQIAASYGIDLSKIGEVQQPPVMDHNLSPFMHELTNTKGEIAALKQRLDAEAEAIMAREINTFAKTAEHFDYFKPRIVQLLQEKDNGIDDLSAAYTKAREEHDELFGARPAATPAQTQAQRDTANRVAKAAKAAAVSVKSSTPGAVASTKAQDRRAMIAEQLDSVETRL